METEIFAGVIFKGKSSQKACPKAWQLWVNGQKFLDIGDEGQNLISIYQSKLSFHWDQDHELKVEIKADTDIDTELHPEINQILSPLIYKADKNEFEKRLKILAWLESLKSQKPNLLNWVGIYYDDSYFGKSKNDLILGPYLGAATPHNYIPKGSGLCGLTMEVGKTLNIPDVSKREEYLACSIETKSELIIPIYNNKNELIAQLDIDGHQIDAFDEQTVAWLEKECLKISKYF